MLPFLLTRTKRRGKIVEEENKKGNLKNRLPFGLCDKYNIKLPIGAKPKDAWDALKSKGINPEEEYKKVRVEMIE